MDQRKKINLLKVVQKKIERINKIKKLRGNNINMISNLKIKY